jgi:flavin reductase (DIM6/NTAB) family NADH-FMN oxidoreductase RutF
LHDTQSDFPEGLSTKAAAEIYGRYEHDVSPDAVTDHADAFRVTMRGAVTGVTIVTTCQTGVDYGMTATAFAPVSMAPPMVLIVVNETTSVYEPLCKSGRFCINILGANQEYIARRFSVKPSDQSRFQSGQWLRDAKSPARLLEAKGWIDCAVDSVIHASTHSVFIGKVMRTHSSGIKPLLYFDGRYAHLTK